VILFGHGNNRNIGSPWGLTQMECAELTRVALRHDHAWPVSKYLSIALRFLKKHCPGLKGVVSYADTGQGHYGGIYQASGWIYTGEVSGMPYWLFEGKAWPQRALSTSHPEIKFSDPRVKRIAPTKKHRYFWAFDEKLSKRIPRFPYPCAESRDAAAPGDQPGEDA
jgi:hypothetical protein